MFGSKVIVADGRVGEVRDRQVLEQRVEAVGERVGVEVFPAESKLVDDANLRHLWVYPAGHQLGFGLREHKFSEQVEGA